MNKRLEPRGIRPSEDIIRRRLVERRLAHEHARKQSGWFSRVRAGNTSGSRMLGGRIGRRPTLTTRLRERPVAAFLAATIFGIAMIGAIGSILRLDGTSDEGERASPQIAGNRAASPADLGPDDISVGSTTRSPPGVIAADRPLLRDTTGALPPSVATPTGARPASPATTAAGISNEAVAAALALRLPQDAQDAQDRSLQDPAVKDGNDPAEAPTLQSEFLATTGSITRAVTQKPVAPDQLAGELQEQAAALDADAAPSASVSAEATAATDAEAAKASVTANVNLRAKPDNDATVLAVLPKGRTVTVEKCDLWCEVSADGKSGYVFKSFVDKAG